MENKNVNGINKIIARLAKRDFEAQWNKLTERKKTAFKINGGFTYALSAETLECIDVKNQFLSGEITEEEYKIFLLKKNLLD